MKEHAQTPSVVSVFPYLSPADRLWTYWNSIRNTGPIPYRRDVRAIDLGDDLDFAFIAESSPLCGGKFRVIGSRLNDILGMDVGGMPLFSILQARLRSEFVEHARTVFRRPAAISLTLSSVAKDSRPDIVAKFVMLPLLDDDGKITRALGGLMCDAPSGHLPRYFDQITDIVLDPIASKTPLKTKKAAPKGRPKFELVK